MRPSRKTRWTCALRRPRAGEALDEGFQRAHAHLFALGAAGGVETGGRRLAASKSARAWRSPSDGLSRSAGAHVFRQLQKPQAVGQRRGTAAEAARQLFLRQPVLVEEWRDRPRPRRDSAAPAVANSPPAHQAAFEGRPPPPVRRARVFHPSRRRGAQTAFAGHDLVAPPPPGAPSAARAGRARRWRRPARAAPPRNRRAAPPADWTKAGKAPRAPFANRPAPLCGPRRGIIYEARWADNPARADFSRGEGCAPHPRSGINRAARRFPAPRGFFPAAACRPPFPAARVVIWSSRRGRHGENVQILQFVENQAVPR